MRKGPGEKVENKMRYLQIHRTKQQRKHKSNHVVH